MRLAVALILALVWSSAAFAQVSHEQLVGLFKDVCVLPETPEAIMLAGGRVAAERNGKLVGSTRGPLPLIHNENGPRLSFLSAWQFDLPESPGVKLFVSIMGPEYPEVRYSFCMTDIPVADFMTEQLASEMERQLGSLLVKGRKHEWHFVQEKAVGNCGKYIVVSESRYMKSNSLMFFDTAWPSDAGAAFTSTRCRQ